MTPTLFLSYSFVYASKSWALKMAMPQNVRYVANNCKKKRRWIVLQDVFNMACFKNVKCFFEYAMKYLPAKDAAFTEFTLYYPFYYQTNTTLVEVKLCF